jgi:hypothetical protein
VFVSGDADRSGGAPHGGIGVQATRLKSARYRLVTMNEPLHSTICAALAQPVQRAASWWDCR